MNDTNPVVSEENFRESSEWHLRYAGVLQLHFIIGHVDLTGVWLG